jgi:hypothetical protein
MYFAPVFTLYIALYYKTKIWTHIGKLHHLMFTFNFAKHLPGAKGLPVHKAKKLNASCELTV